MAPLARNWIPGGNFSKRKYEALCSSVVFLVIKGVVYCYVGARLCAAPRGVDIRELGHLLGGDVVEFLCVASANTHVLQPF
jgi:hypothetical protein